MLTILKIPERSKNSKVFPDGFKESKEELYSLAEFKDEEGNKCSCVVK